jgi:hypothetical protein
VSRRLQRTAENRAKHLAAREAAAKTPEDKAALMYDACRTVAVHQALVGHPEVWDALASHLAAFYRRYAQ